MTRKQMLLIENMALLIRRMARRIKLRNHPDDIGLADNALEFLGKCGLGGNICRTPDSAPSLPVEQVEPERVWRARNVDLNKTATVSMRAEDVSMFRQCNADFVIQFSTDGGKTWQDLEARDGK